MKLYKLTIIFSDSTVTRTFDDYAEAQRIYRHARKAIMDEGGPLGRVTLTIES